MDYHVFKDMINKYFFKHVDGDNRPVYFDIDQTYPRLKQITESFTTIRDEFDHVYASRSLPNYHDIDPGEKEISDATENNWKVFLLYLMGRQTDAAKELCPKTLEVLSKIPNLMQAFFSILEPRKSVPLHEGPYLGYLRYHLGLRTPKNNPPSIFVKGQPHTWEAGKDVLFDDSWPHEVVNESDEPRAVLIVDVLRPMPVLPTLVNKVMTNVVGKHTYGRSIIKRAKNYS